MDECRKDFEEWYSENNDVRPGELDRTLSGYNWVGTDSAWDVWQAAWKTNDKSKDRCFSYHEEIPALMIDWAESQGFEMWLRDHRAVLENFYAWLDVALSSRTEAKVSGEVCLTCGKIGCAEHPQLFPPQSPVVPGVEEILGAMGIGTARWRDESWDNPAKKESQFQAEAIHAHLLANARESREGVLREALEKLKVIAGSCNWQFLSDERGPMLEIIERALATVGKEG